jgi:hypothetical protein
MPMLQRVEPCSITANALSLLAQGLPDLRTLRIDHEPLWIDANRIYDWPLVRASLAVCCQLTDLTLVAAPLDELDALLLVLPPSVHLLTLRRCDVFLGRLHRMRG